MPKNARHDSGRAMHLAAERLPDQEIENHAKASEIIAKAALLLDDDLSKTSEDILRDALVLDLEATEVESARAEDRLAKVEAQVHALADAVIVIGTPSGDIDNAVQALKDKL